MKPAETEICVDRPSCSLTPGAQDMMADTAATRLTGARAQQRLETKLTLVHEPETMALLRDEAVREEELEEEEIDPSFAHFDVSDLPAYEAEGLSARLIAGAAFGAKAPVPVRSPMFYVHWTMKAGARGELPAEYPERAAYVARGGVEVDGRTFGAGEMLVFAPGQPVVLTAATDAIVMLLGGEPIGERFIEWNFVSSSKARIEQAKADWRAGRMKLPDADDEEFIPLPGDPPPEANPMS